jgi:hypothetical protein
VAAGEWEKLATEIIIPGLQQAAVELNGRTEIEAEYSHDPSGDACLLWIARRRPTSPFLWPEGWLTIDDDAARVRVEETASGARPVSSYLPSSDVSVSGIRARALAFAERLISAETRDQRSCGESVQGPSRQ